MNLLFAECLQSLLLSRLTMVGNGKEGCLCNRMGQTCFLVARLTVWIPEYLCGQGKGWGAVGVRNSFPHSLLHLTDTHGAVSLERVVRGSRAVVSSQSLVSQSLQSTETQVVTVSMSVMGL